MGNFSALFRISATLSEGPMRSLARSLAEAILDEQSIKTESRL